MNRSNVFQIECIYKRSHLRRLKLIQYSRCFAQLLCHIAFKYVQPEHLKKSPQNSRKVHKIPFTHCAGKISAKFPVNSRQGPSLFTKVQVCLQPLIESNLVLKTTPISDFLTFDGYSSFFQSLYFPRLKFVYIK